jgi:6-phosphogluconolactonase/glucosamine-6-phosphate isomerase/deaminase
MTTETQIIYYKTKEETAATAGETLNELLLENQKKPILLLLSGGSALEILDYVGEKALSENVTITMLDERFSEDSKANNFLALQKTEFYTLAQNKECSFFGTLPRPNESLEDFAARFGNNLKVWIEKNPKGKIFGVFGIGQDGHTAGIFPNNNEKEFNEMFNAQSLSVGYDAKNNTPLTLRITATLTFFKLINNAIIFACGKEKKSALLAFKEKTLPVYLLPALGILQTKSHQLFTDQIL